MTPFILVWVKRFLFNIVILVFSFTLIVALRCFFCQPFGHCYCLSPATIAADPAASSPAVSIAAVAASTAPSASATAPAASASYIFSVTTFQLSFYNVRINNDICVRLPIFVFCFAKAILIFSVPKFHNDKIKSFRIILTVYLMAICALATYRSCMAVISTMLFKSH